MKERREVDEPKEAKGISKVKEREGNIAAFFDLDGTLMALPSVEKRFFRMLRYRGEIPARNYFLWLREATRLLPRGIAKILQANKMYLRGVPILNERGGRDGDAFSWHKDGHQAEGQAWVSPRRNPRLSVLTFLAQAIERVAWHAKQEHEIVLVSGTLEPLAKDAARAMEAKLASRGITVKIRVCATWLEETGGRWTGRILGEAMFGKAKARAAKRLAEDMRLDLDRCYAYGDSLNDRWLLAAVGRAVAVNPSKHLADLARACGWPVMDWGERESPTQRHAGRDVQRNCRMELVRPENTE